MKENYRKGLSGNKPLGKPGIKGFTLIELVCTMVILWVLTAGILPRFIDLRSSASLAVTQEVAAVLGQSIAFIHATWLLSGKPQGASANHGPIVELDGIDIRVDPATGYPVGDAGIDSADTMSLPDCVTVFDAAVNSQYTLEPINNVTLENYQDFDFLVSRTNSAPDICNYYWSSSLTSIPNNSTPSQGLGLRYFVGTGDVTVFEFP